MQAYANGRRRETDSEDMRPVFNEELGLAIEPLPPGFTLSLLTEIR